MITHLKIVNTIFFFFLSLCYLVVFTRVFFSSRCFGSSFLKHRSPHFENEALGLTSLPCSKYTIALTQTPIDLSLLRLDLVFLN